jgi:hypothetical protein
MLDVQVFIISLQGYSLATHKLVGYHILFLTVQCYMHVHLNLEMYKKLLNDIADGLNHENPYCIDLCHLGLSVQQGGLTADANAIPWVIDQPAHMTMSVCAVLNCRQTGVASLQVTTTNGSISDVKMNLEMVEGLCFPLFYPHG